LGKLFLKSQINNQLDCGGFFLEDPMKKSGIKNRILIPLTLALVILLTTFIFGLYWIQKKIIVE